MSFVSTVLDFAPHLPAMIQVASPAIYEATTKTSEMVGQGLGADCFQGVAQAVSHHVPTYPEVMGSAIANKLGQVADFVGNHIPLWQTAAMNKAHELQTQGFEAIQNAYNTTTGGKGVFQMMVDNAADYSSKHSPDNYWALQRKISGYQSDYQQLATRLNDFILETGSKLQRPGVLDALKETAPMVRG